MESFKSGISAESFPIKEQVKGNTIRQSILDLIQVDYPNFKEKDSISESEYNQYREKYITQFLTKQKRQLSKMEKTVLDTIADNTTISDKLEVDEKVDLTFGQRVADNVATFGGSWTFIISFGVFLLIWILINVLVLRSKSFDPFPFILLNLILSCIAALQAPVIMMSQNRQEEKDRERAKKDYMINLKSELEIRTLHEKVDHLIIQQQEEFIELQKVQIEMMTDILNKVAKSN